MPQLPGFRGGGSACLVHVLLPALSRGCCARPNSSSDSSGFCFAWCYTAEQRGWHLDPNSLHSCTHTRPHAHPQLLVERGIGC